MLEYVKKFTIFSLISVGVSFVLFLFFGNTNPRINSFDIAVNGSALSNAGPLEKLAGGISEVLGVSFSEKGDLKPEDLKSDPTNLTETFAKLIAEKLIAGNPNGAQQIDGAESLIIPGGLDLNNPELQQKFELLKNEVFSSAKIDESKLNIINTTNKEDLRNYFFTLESSYFKLYENNKLIIEVKSPGDTLKNFEIFGNIFRNYLDILYTMKVPAVFKDFHLKAIRATAAEVKITEIVLNYAQDPLKALGIKNLQDELESQVKNITKEEIYLMNKYGVSLK